MNQYVIRCHVKHVLVVEAETEVEAREQASQTQFNDWDHHPSECSVEVATSPGPKRPEPMPCLDRSTSFGYIHAAGR